MKARYRALCDSEAGIPVFSQYWWLDAVAGGSGWDVAMVEVAGEVRGCLPYADQRRYGHRISVQPPLTQCLGPWLAPMSCKSGKALAIEKDVMQALIAQLPRFAHFSQNWSWRRTNWLPFYWAGFSQTTRYTYRIPVQDAKASWAGLLDNIRTDVRKAESRFGLRVREDLGLEDFLPLYRRVFARQRLGMPCGPGLLEALDSACRARGQRAILVAEDGEGRRHAAAYLVWDRDTMYYLMGGSDPDLRASGATSLCLWQGIRMAAERGLVFDFEGSMLEPVERYFRAFGAVQTPYFRVSRTDSLSWRMLQQGRELLGAWRG